MPGAAAAVKIHPGLLPSIRCLRSRGDFGADRREKVWTRVTEEDRDARVSARSVMDHSFFPVLIFFAVALAVPLGALAFAYLLTRLITPAKPGVSKLSLYECGVDPLSSRQTRFHSKYYMFGLLFLLFDVETVFLLPFAVAFLDLPWQAFVGAMLFLLLLAEGLLWAWTKGLLDWRAKPPGTAARSSL